MPDIQGPAASSPATREAVRALLAAAGLRPAEPEIDAMTAQYRGFRAAADRLRATVDDDDPAPVFDPVRTFSAGPASGLPQADRDA